MNTTTTTATNSTTTPRRTRRPRRIGRNVATALAAVLVAGGVAGVAVATSGTTPSHGGHGHGGAERDLIAATLANAAYQDVAVAEQAGYASSLESLGCFQDPAQGGMGVHYINDALMDGQVDVRTPEALVYELDADGNITGLVAHEYIVPVDAWTAKKPPRLFGMDFHRHPVLPLWVLHVWLWKDNPSGLHADFNPAVRLCPAGVPIFGATD